MSEISKFDQVEMKAPVDNFKNITPEKELSVKELNSIVGQEFNKAGEEYRSELSTKEYQDDNGKVFRIGNELVPNNEYEVNGYKYQTDDKGRIVSASGQLRMRDKNFSRNMENRDNLTDKGYQENDQRSHLIGYQFGGSGKLENIVPMDGSLNQGDYEKMENTLAEAVKDNAKVYLKVEPVYESDEKRPSEFRITYSIDGDKTAIVFRNESGDNHDK